MLTPDQYQRIAHTLPFLKEAPPRLIQQFKDHTYLYTIPAGKDIFIEGDYPDSLALVISGVVRVYKLGYSGREITLYRFGLGESCILTANAILSDRSFPAIATAEEDIEAVIIPAGKFKEWVNKFDLWREFVFDLLSDRLSSVMSIIDEILFQHMDQRLASWLLKNENRQSTVEVTHQEIADELGSSREVISRILEDFNQEGLIETGRGAIKLIDIEGLKSRMVM